MAKRKAGTGDLLSKDALSALLADSPDDEKTGVNATSGFTYQQWWAALVVTELLETGDDFAVALEVKEDVAILDSASAPTRVEFCQVKKNENAGAWTLAQLHAKGKARKGAKPDKSTLAKLYGRRNDFAPHPSHLKFVSNVGFKVPISNHKLQSEDCHLADLSTEHQQAMKTAIGAELDIHEHSIDFNDVRLHRSNLPMAEQALFVAGKLSFLGETGVLQFKLEMPVVAAHFLASEIRAKASNTSYALTYSDLKQKRIYSRANALSSLAHVAQAVPTTRDILADAVKVMSADPQIGFATVKDIQQVSATVCAHAMDRTNLQIRNLVKAMHSIYDEIMLDKGASLGKLMVAMTASVHTASPTATRDLPDGYINAVSLLVLNNAINIDVLTPSIGSQSEEGK